MFPFNSWYQFHDLQRQLVTEVEFTNFLFVHYQFSGMPMEEEMGDLAHIPIVLSGIEIKINK